MDLKKYVEAHDMIYGALGKWVAEESIRAIRILWPDRMGELVPARLTPVAGYGKYKALSGTEETLVSTGQGLISDGISLALHPSFWSFNKAALMNDLSNTIVHEYMHRMTSSRHNSRAWATECQRIFDLAHINVRVTQWKKLTLEDGSRVGGSPAGTLDYEWLCRFPAPITQGLLDRIENQATPIDMPKAALSTLEVTTASRGRPRKVA